MAVGKRKQISKKTRFEVFKRDGFECQYCGAYPPSVILHVDHIVAVSNGGTNDMDNLVTACQPCNLGKSANALTDVPQSLKDRAAEVAEREEQLRGYNAVMQGKRDRMDDETWDVAEILKPGSSKDGFNRSCLTSVRMFVDRLGYWPVREAAEMARAKKPWSFNQAFKYFCGICWNKIREADGTR